MQALTGYAVLLLLAGMVAGWAFRRLLLARLRTRHPDVFQGLGAPGKKELLSHMPRHREMHIRLWRFVWGRGFRHLPDAAVHRYAALAMAGDVTAAAGGVLLFVVAAAR